MISSRPLIAPPPQTSPPPIFFLSFKLKLWVVRARIASDTIVIKYYSLRHSLPQLSLWRRHQLNVKYNPLGWVIGRGRDKGTNKYIDNATYRKSQHSGRFSERLFYLVLSTPQPSECGRQRTLNSLHEHNAAKLQSNGNFAV